jgi:hypothetical protein
MTGSLQFLSSCIDDADQAQVLDEGVSHDTPARLWQHAPYFHDGSAATLTDVVKHYNRVRSLGLRLSEEEEERPTCAD